MTDPGSHEARETATTGADLRAISFPASHAFGRGYDPREVDAYAARCAALVDDLRQQLQAQAQQISELRDRIERDSRSQEVVHAVSILTSAQQTADRTVAEADSYSTKVMSDARNLYEDARRNAATLEQETEAKAKHVYDEALARASSLERETEQRVADLTMSAVTAQAELDQQTAYLRTLRDATRTQMEVFLEGMLDRVAEEYGKAHPLAVEAAKDGSRRPRRPRKSSGKAGAQNGRAPASAARVAGVAAERRVAMTRDVNGSGAPRTAPGDPAGAFDLDGLADGG